MKSLVLLNLLLLFIFTGCTTYEDIRCAESGLFMLEVEIEEAKEKNVDPSTIKIPLELEEKISSLHLKSRTIGIFIAAVPGFFIHGLGHFYAGDTKRGEEFLVEEVCGIGCLAIGVLFICDIGEDDDDDNHYFEEEDSDSFCDPIMEGVIGVGGVLLGTGLFAGSYYLDIVGTSDAVGKFNKRVRKIRNRFKKIRREIKPKK